MTTLRCHSSECLTQGVLESAFFRNRAGSHEFANLVRDAAGSAGVSTSEDRGTVTRLLEHGLADLQARGIIMKDRRNAYRAWLLTPPVLADRPAGSSQRTRADDRVTLSV
jgi:hypothetical protein